MAKQTILVSDLNGKPVEVYAKVTILTEGTRFVLDADRSEVEKMISKARALKPAGRKAQ